ncbi:MAG: ATP-dependent helicase [Ignavibacteriaceae bacterium]|nr:ATP-dependent helicase [Ignavibacteriaceae bacterium]
MKLPTPKGRQQEVVYLPEKGHTVVLGTAGSGKTSMAMLRAIHLQNTHCRENEKTLVLTYNKMLISYMSSFEEFRTASFSINSYYKVAYRVLSSKNLMSNGYLDSNRKKQLIEISKNTVAQMHSDALLKRDYMVFFEEIKWIQSFGIRTLQEYETTQRTGRKGTRINREKRKYIWYVYEDYKNRRANSGFNVDWDDAPIFVEDILRSNNSDLGYKHIIIDEGQDFTPAMIKSISAGLPQQGSLTFFGDVAQQIYGSRISWKDAGLRPPKVWEFKENYRNSKEIADLALEITKSKYFSDEPDIVAPNIVKAASAKPTLVKFKNKDEFSEVLNIAINLAQNQQLAILVRKRDLVRQIIGQLKSRTNQIPIEELHDQRGEYLPERGIMVGTYHSAKGLEFDTVIMPFCTSSIWPSPERISEIGEEDTSVEDIRLLYVGVTRAKTGLIISYTQTVTALLPASSAFYNLMEM